MGNRHKRSKYCGAELPKHSLASEAKSAAGFRAWNKGDKRRQARQADVQEKANRASID